MKTRLALLITAVLLAVGLPLPAQAASPFAFTAGPDGEATITGYSTAAPRTLVIPAEVTDDNGTYRVTAIGTQAFQGGRLTSVTFPDTVTTIGDFAFTDNRLAEVTLPDTVTTIGDYAFSYNLQLTDLTLPDSLTTIGIEAFYNNRLTDLTLPDSLTTIGDGAFFANRLTDLSVPARVTSIGGAAFDNNLDLDTVRFTGPAPQLGATALGSSNPAVRFPWKLGAPRAAGGYTAPTWNGYATTAVADVTFTGAGDIAAQTVDVDGTSTALKPADPTKPGRTFTGWFTDGATTPFDFATPITSDTALAARFAAETPLVLEGPELVAAKLGADVSWTPTTLAGDPAPTVTATGLPDGLEIDSSTGAISGTVTDAALAGDHDVTITASNDVDPDATLDLTISIEYFTSDIDDGEASVTITGYHGTAPADLVVPDSIDRDGRSYPVVAIGDAAFSGAGLTSVRLPDAITTIGGSAFAGNALTELVIGPHVADIGTYSVANNPSLASIRFRGPVPAMKGSAPFGQSDPVIRYPWKYEAPRGGYTPTVWKGHESIAVADVTFTGADDVAAQEVDVDGTSTAVKPADPTKARHRFTGWYLPEADEAFDFATPIAGDTVLSAGFEARNAPVLAGPTTTTAKVGDAFEWTPTTLTGDPAPTVTASGLPDGLEIDRQTGVISGTVTDAGLYGDHYVTITASNDVDPDATLYLTISIEYFGYSIDDGEATLTGYYGTVPTDLVIPAEISVGDDIYPVTAIAGQSFRERQLATLTLPDTLVSIGEYAFYDNQLTDLDLPESITTISDGAFFDNQLTELTLPNTVTTIGDDAFFNNHLTDLTLPTNLTAIGSSVFSGNRLTELSLPDSLTTIGSGAFRGNRLTAVDLPENLTTIAVTAFYDNLLTEVAVPANVTSIGVRAFDDNSDLDDIRFAGAAPQLGDRALGTNEPTVRFSWKLGAPRTAGGYTTPTWYGYETTAVADVTFAGADQIAPQRVDVDGRSTVARPANPTKTGRVFTGWYAGTSATPFNFAKPITGDVVLTARFAPAVITGLAPSIVGNPREGATLTARPGKISPSDVTLTYQWRANYRIIKGATKPTLKLGKAHAAKRITVTIAARTTGVRTVTKTSATTKIVSSAKRRLVLSTSKVGKNKPVTVTAAGFNPRQKITIRLAGTKRYTGRADARGIITKTVTFAKTAKAGTRRVEVTSYRKNGKKDKTIRTTVRYR